MAHMESAEFTVTLGVVGSATVADRVKVTPGATLKLSRSCLTTSLGLPGS